MLADLKPRTKRLVFDLAEEAGLDMTDWRDSSNDPRGPKANPKYCYEWAYLQPGKLIILNLWQPDMVEENGQIILRANYRADAQFHRTTSHKAEWARRAQSLDNAIKAALDDKLQVRVIILDGVQRKKEEFVGDPSRVKCRELDVEPWTITDYDRESGAFELTRGIVAARYIDQFDINQADKAAPERRDRSASVFNRDSAVRRRVLDLAEGRCEMCGGVGFRTEGGAVYLETHHVIPLSEGGPDIDQNVVALCANDHRRAHFADDRAAIRDQLLIRCRTVRK